MKKMYYILFTIIATVCILVLHKEDKIDYQFDARNLHVIETDYNLLENTEMEKYYYVIQESSGFNGCFTWGPYCSLPKGNYKVSILYEADSEGNTFDVVENLNPIATDADFQFSPSESCEEFQIFLKDDATNIEIRTFYGGKGTFRLKSIQITGIDYQSMDAVIYAGAFLICMILLGMFFFGINERFRLRWMSDDTSVFVFIFLLASFLLSSYPAETNFISVGHDTFFHLGRIQGIADALREGQIPVRLHPNTMLGYGYAAAVMYPELFLYPIAIIRLLGMSLTGCYNLLLIFINGLTVICAYIAFRKLFTGQYVAAFATVLYLFAPYRLVCLYVRGAIGEVMAMAFLPLAFAVLSEVVYGKKEKWIALTVVYSFVLNSHIISFLLLCITTILYLGIHWKQLMKKEIAGAFAKSVFAGVLMNTWFLIPFIDLYMQGLQTELIRIELSDHVLYLGQLFEAVPYHMGSSMPYGSSLNGEMYLGIGIVIILGNVFTLFSMYKRNTESVIEIKKIFILEVVLIWAVTWMFPWSIISQIPLFGNIIGMIQFPWRLLSCISVLSVITAVWGYSEMYQRFLKSTGMKTVLILLLLANIFVCNNLFTETLHSSFTLSKYQVLKDYALQEVGTNGEYYLKNTMANKMMERGQVITSPNDRVEIQRWEREGSCFQIWCNNDSDTSGYLELPVGYYDGYRAEWENGSPIITESGSNNVLRLTITPKTEGRITVYYKEKILWRLAEVVSMIYILLLLCLKKRGKQNVEEKDS